jgi:hypothetical protein
MEGIILMISGLHPAAVSRLKRLGYESLLCSLASGIAAGTTAYLAFGRWEVAVAATLAVWFGLKSIKTGLGGITMGASLAMELVKEGELASGNPESTSRAGRRRFR